MQTRYSILRNNLLLVQVLVLVFLMAGCTRVRNVSNHNVYSPFAGKTVAIMKANNLYKNSEGGRILRDFRVDSSNLSYLTLIGGLKNGTLMKIDKFVAVERGGVHRLMAIGTVNFGGTDYPVEYIVRMEADPIDPYQYPLPFTVIPNSGNQ